MRVAFVHYHLKPGGVTSVIRRQAEALTGVAETLVISGEPPPAEFALPAAVVPGLAYDTVRERHHTARETAARVLSAISLRWPDGCDLLHIHNPTLAKNRLLPEVLQRLQAQGMRLLLQIHDFAEDARPGAYSAAPYPADCHYAVLNRRDRTLLHTVGLRPEGVHLLPNQVSAPAPPADPTEPSGNHVLYPVRAIRRKNIGEAVLSSLFLTHHRYLAVTLGPNSPSDFGPYRFWQAFVARHRLPLAWEVAREGDFRHLVQTACHITTTSVAEGFGFAFLEPWTAGKLLRGRRLPTICSDFTENGVNLDHLYEVIRIPLAWLDVQRWRTRWLQAAAAARTAFGRMPNPEAEREAFERLAAAEFIDFGLLDEPLQADVIRRCIDRATDRARCGALNPGLTELQATTDPSALIAANAEAVAHHYGLEAGRRRLTATYAAACTPVRQAIDKGRLLDLFLDLDRFSLLRWGTWKP